MQELDPAFFERIGQGPLAEGEVVEARLPRLEADGDAEAARLDARLGARVSLLVDYMARAEETTADAVRAVLGASPAALGDDAALERLLDPGHQPLPARDAAARRCTRRSGGRCTTPPTRS